MKSNLVIFWLILVSLLVFACKKGGNISETSQAKGNLPVDSADYISVSTDQFATAGMELGGIQSYDYAEWITANGYLDVPADNRAKIGTFMGGYVETAGLMPGDHVQKGELLIVLENIEYLKLRQSFLEAKEQMEYLKSVYESQKLLAEEKISSQRNYLQAKSDYNCMLATYESLAKQLQLLNLDPLSVNAEHMVSKIELKSPIDGYITKANAVRGMFVNPSDILYEIINPGHMHIELKVFEKDVFKLQKGQSITFRIPETSGKSYKGEIIIIGKEIEGEDRTVTVHGHITGKPDTKLTPGMYIEAMISANPQRLDGLPVEAVVNQEGKTYVYIKDAERAGKYYFKKVPVRISQSNEDWLAVSDSSGALHRADNNILIKGAYYLSQD